MRSPRTANVKVARGLLTLLLITIAPLTVGGIERNCGDPPSSRSEEPDGAAILLSLPAAADGPDAIRAIARQKQRELITVFRHGSRDFLRSYYDFRLGLLEEEPIHAELQQLVRDLRTGLAKTTDHSAIPAWVLGKLDEAHHLENEAQLRQAVNELAFLLTDLPAADGGDAPGEPPMDLYVEEPWRPVRPSEFLLACNTQELLRALDSDSLPDVSKTGLEVYRQLRNASAVLIEEKLPGNSGETKAELIAIESPAELNPVDGTIRRHPVLMFRIHKTFLDTYDRDSHGDAKLKPFDFQFRQVTKTLRDQQGNITQFVVTHELMDPVLVGGSPRLGQYGFQFYKTALKAMAVQGDEDSTLVQFRLLVVPDFRGRLARSRLRRAVSAFIYLENRKVKSRIVERVKENWPTRVAVAQPPPAVTPTDQVENDLAE